MKCVEYVTQVPCTVTSVRHGQKDLPSGSFMTIIDKYYWPKDVKEWARANYLDSEREVMCFCFWGMAKIRREYVREL